MHAVYFLCGPAFNSLLPHCYFFCMSLLFDNGCWVVWKPTKLLQLGVVKISATIFYREILRIDGLNVALYKWHDSSSFTHLKNCTSKKACCAYKLLSILAFLNIMLSLFIIYGHNKHENIFSDQLREAVKWKKRK